MIVTDASVIIEVLLRTPAGVALEDRLLSARESLHAPELLDIEVAQVIRRYAARGEITAVRGRMMLELLSAFPIERYPHAPLLPRVWTLRNSLTAYDAAYVALAEALGAPLLTGDTGIAKAAGHRAKVELASYP